MKLTHGNCDDRQRDKSRGAGAVTIGRAPAGPVGILRRTNPNDTRPGWRSSAHPAAAAGAYPLKARNDDGREFTRQNL